MKKLIASVLTFVLTVSVFTGLMAEPTLAASAVDNAVSSAVGIANNSAHGYDQTYRWGPNYDCSSLVITAYQNAGVPVKSNGATYTGNMYSVFTRTGFKDVTSSVNRYNGSGLRKADVLLNHVNHTAMVSSVSNGVVYIVQASINEFGGTKGGRSGDQTGREINVSRYSNNSYGGWNAVLRHSSSYQTTNPTPPPTNGSYYPRYTGSSVSLMDSLKAVGVNYTWTLATQIAAANGISGYTGTAAQNTKLLNLLKQGTLRRPGTTNPTPTGNYYPRYTGSSVSLMDSLKAVGVNYTWTLATQIAKANGITNYTGTAAQNTQLLNLLKAGKLVKAGSTTTVRYFPRYTGSSVSLVDSLKAVGATYSWTYATQIARVNGISNYSGTAAQNTQLLNLLKAGRLIKP